MHLKTKIKFNSEFYYPKRTEMRGWGCTGNTWKRLSKSNLFQTTELSDWNDTPGIQHIDNRPSRPAPNLGPILQGSSIVFVQKTWVHSGSSVILLTAFRKSNCMDQDHSKADVETSNTVTQPHDLQQWNTKQDIPGLPKLWSTSLLQPSLSLKTKLIWTHHYLLIIVWVLLSYNSKSQ